MKKSIFLLLLLPILMSCSRAFIQVCDTGSTNTKIIDKYYCYETDTLKITYSFWTKNGVLSYTIYNKLDKPIYIDWKNSSFIHNDKAYDYWKDITISETSGAYDGIYYNGPLLSPGYTVNVGYLNATSSTIKPERITFIPPKSYCYRSKFYLWTNGPFNCKSNCTTELVQRNDKPKRKTMIYDADFTLNNSPLRFRNYLAISLSEKSENYFFIDNEFYVKSITEMDYRHFNGTFLGYNGNLPIYEKSKYEKETAFYLNVLRKR